jgi:hypothetical protein
LDTWKTRALAPEALASFEGCPLMRRVHFKFEISNIRFLISVINFRF